MKYIKRLLLLAFIATDTVGFTQKMPESANQVYTNFCNSVKNKDLSAYKSTLTLASFIRQKNEALSYGINYPADLFEMLSATMFDLKDMNYIGYKKEGQMMNVFYLYDYKLEKMILTICMEEHNSELRIDQMKMRDALDFIKQLNENDFSFINEKEFLPSGKLKPVPVEVSKVEFTAMLDISCYGYKVEVKVNEISQDEVADKSRSGVLIGGIVKGENKVEMKFEKINSEETFPPSVSIRTTVDNVEKDVFKFDEVPSGTTIIKYFEFK